jgi:hypothetical protein
MTSDPNNLPQRDAREFARQAGAQDMVIVPNPNPNESAEILTMAEFRRRQTQRLNSLRERIEFSQQLPETPEVMKRLRELIETHDKIMNGLARLAARGQ